MDERYDTICHYRSKDILDERGGLYAIGFRYGKNSNRDNCFVYIYNNMHWIIKDKSFENATVIDNVRYYTYFGGNADGAHFVREGTYVFTDDDTGYRIFAGINGDISAV